MAARGSQLLLLLRIGEARTAARTVGNGRHLHGRDGLHNGAARQTQRTGNVGRTAARADADVIIALLQHECRSAFAEDSHLRDREAERQHLLFTGVERARLLEAVELPARSALRVGRGEIDLHDLLHGIGLAGVFDLCRDHHVTAVQTHRHRGQLRLAVAKPVAEGVEHVSAEGIEPAVADEAVERLRGLVKLRKRHRPAVRQTAGRHDARCQQVCQRVAALLTGNAHEHDRGHALRKLTELHIARRVEHEHRALERRADRPDHVRLLPRQLRAVILRRACEHDDRSRAALRQLLHAQHRERELLACRVLHAPVAVLVDEQTVRLYDLACGETVEHADLMPRLHLRRAAGGEDLPHAEDGDGQRLIAVFCEGKGVADIFQQHHAARRSGSGRKGVVGDPGCIFHDVSPVTSTEF